MTAYYGQGWLCNHTCKADSNNFAWHGHSLLKHTQMETLGWILLWTQINKIKLNYRSLEKLHGSVMKFNDSGLGPVYIMCEQRAENSAQTTFSKITAESKGSNFRYGLIKAQVMFIRLFLSWFFGSAPVPALFPIFPPCLAKITAKLSLTDSPV